MIRKLSFLLMLAVMAIVANAQERVVSGSLTDRDTKETVPYVTVQLLDKDSTFVAGSISDDNGNFRIEATIR